MLRHSWSRLEPWPQFALFLSFGSSYGSTEKIVKKLALFSLHSPGFLSVTSEKEWLFKECERCSLSAVRGLNPTLWYAIISFDGEGLN
jgi:hypothetical protein